MSLPDVRPQTNLLSEFVPAIVGAFGLGVPIAAAIIWVCSWSLCRFAPFGRAKYATDNRLRDDAIQLISPRLLPPSGGYADTPPYSQW